MTDEAVKDAYPNPRVGMGVTIKDVAGERYIPAVVTRIHEDGSINVRAFPDGTDAVPCFEHVIHDSGAPDQDKRLYVTWMHPGEAEQEKEDKAETAKLEAMLAEDSSDTAAPASDLDEEEQPVAGDQTSTTLGAGATETPAS